MKRTFTVVEVQEVSEFEVFTYEVDAETEAEAIEIVRSGQGPDPAPIGTYGDPDYGKSGFAASADTENDQRDLRDEAAEDLGGRL